MARRLTIPARLLFAMKLMATFVVGRLVKLGPR